MNITADAVKQLRERTGAGMMECKKALVETRGDLDAAAELMRKQGLAKADKKAARVAAEGVIVIEQLRRRPRGRHGRGQLRDRFRGARSRTSAPSPRPSPPCRSPARPPTLEALLQAKLDGARDHRGAPARAGGQDRREHQRAPLRRARARRGHLGAYVHGTRIGALVAVKGGDAALAHDLAMHVAASNPKYLTQREVPAEVIAKEREILTEQAQGEGKPPEIVAKMVEGRLRKSLGEITLAGQPFVKDPDHDDREAAEGREGARWSRSSASRSARASRRSRMTSWRR